MLDSLILEYTGNIPDYLCTISSENLIVYDTWMDVKCQSRIYTGTVLKIKIGGVDASIPRGIFFISHTMLQVYFETTNKSDFNAVYNLNVDKQISDSLKLINRYPSFYNFIINTPFFYIKIADCICPFEHIEDLTVYPKPLIYEYDFEKIDGVFKRVKLSQQAIAIEEEKIKTAIQFLVKHFVVITLQPLL